MGVIKTNRNRAFLLILGLCLTQIAVGQNSKGKELPNFHRVNQDLYRGGQPSEDGLKHLRELGIKTVINLRDDDERADTEGAAALGAGLRYFNLPLASFHRPSDHEVAEILSVINEPDNQPVFLHCKRGSDRTGIIVAVYRIDHDGWTGSQAKDEAKRFGLGFWQVRLKDYLDDYYRHKPPHVDKRSPESPKIRE